MSRVAGLLEIADIEFMEVRDASLGYRDQVASEIEQNDLRDIELNSISYLEFIRSSPLVRELDDFIKDEVHVEVDAAADADEDFLVECLRSVNLLSIGELQERLQENLSLLKAFERVFLSEHAASSNVPLGPAISIFHLVQIMSLKQGGIEGLAAFYDQHRISGSGDVWKSAQDTANAVKLAEASLA
jgi:hypothetical protein